MGCRSRQSHPTSVPSFYGDGAGEPAGGADEAGDGDGTGDGADEGDGAAEGAALGVSLGEAIGDEVADGVPGVPDVQPWVPLRKISSASAPQPCAIPAGW